jgi:Na+-transporting NADH:ubiquinone oxidoreductase subunit NqrB
VPTLVAALTLVALLKMSHVEMQRWHLAFWFAVLLSLALAGSMSWLHLLANGAGSFLAGWLYFGLLERTDNRADRVLHWAILVGGFVLLIGARLWIDIRVYGVSL